MEDTHPLPLAPPGHTGQPPASGVGGRWCPYCGADLSGVPLEERPHEEDAAFGTAGRRLKIAIAAAFVLVWLGLSIVDWFEDPATVLLPGWFSALGALMLFYLLGLDPVRFFRRRG